MINTNDIGKVEITKNAFNDMADLAINKIPNIYPLKKGGGYANSDFKDNNLVITISLMIKIGSDVVKTSEKIQTKVHEIIYEMTGIDCKQINVDVQGFITK